MTRFVLLIAYAVVVIAFSVEAAPRSARIRRGYNNSGSGYGRGSDERDASGSGEIGCSSDGGKSNYSGSHELGYKDGSSKYGQSSTGSSSQAGAGSGSTSGYGSGRSYAKASATANASAYNKKNNVT